MEAKQFLDEAMDIYRELGKTHSHHSVKVLKQVSEIFKAIACSRSVFTFISP